MLQPLFFIIENFMDASQIGKELAPLVSPLFVVKDRGVRGALLSKVAFLSQHLDKNTLNSSVFEPLCSGFNDSSPALRELTLKATLGLVPSLSSPNLEKLMRYLVRLQTDTETSIRTNSVIFIAKLAPQMSDMSREKMLLPAYARAMRDPFAPCRLAALQSTLKSKDLFTMNDLATKVLPATMPLLLDPLANVRKEAFQVVNHFLASLKQESDRMETMAQQQQQQQQLQQQQQAAQQPQQHAPALAQPTQTGGPSQVAAASEVAPSPSSGRYLSGLSSWMSSSTKPETAAAAGAAAPVAPPPAVPRAAPRAAPPVQQFAATSLAAPVPAPAADDGWGDDEEEEDDGWGDEDNENDLAFSSIGAKSTPASTPSTFSSPSTYSTPNQFAMPNSFSAADNDDPFAAIGMKTTTTRPAARGKLILPKKATSTLKVKAAAPATKLKLDDSEMADGWDDF
jgi:SCY1-like protein 1